MIVGLTECDPVIVAGTASEFRIFLDASSERDTVVRLTVTPGVSIGRLTLTLTDGTPLACRVRRKGAQCTVRCGPVRRPAILTAEVAADIPLTVDRARVDVAVNDRTEVVECELRGEPRIVAGRCAISVVPNPVEPGETFDLRAELFNDGTLAANAEVHLRLPDGVFVPAPPDGAWWSLDEAGRRILIVPTGLLPVAEMLERVIPMRLDVVVGDEKELLVEGAVSASGETFALDPASINVRAHARVEVGAVLTGPARAFRYGDRIEIALHVRGRGNEAAKGVVVTMPGEFVAWDAAEHGSSLRFDLGAILPGSEATFMCTGRVISSPPKLETRALQPVGFAHYGEVDSSAVTCSLIGEARLDARGIIESADARGCHEVRVVLTNVGDGDAPSLQLRTVRIPGVRAIVDSLAVDGMPVYELDGSLAIEGPAGLTLGPVGIRATRTVTWLVRAERSGAYAIPLWLTHDGTERFAQIVADLTDRQDHEAALQREARDTAPASPQDGDVQLDVSDASMVSPSAPEDTPTLDAVAQAEIAFADETKDGLPDEPSAELHDAEASQPATGDAAVNDRPECLGESPVPDVRALVPQYVYEMDMHSCGTWTTWFPTPPKTGDPLGRFVLAARAFLPHEVIGAQPGVMALLLGLRSEVEAVHEAIARSSHLADEFAPSGFDFGTAPLRATIRSLADTFDLACVDLEGVGLDRALVGMIGSNEINSATQCVDQLRITLLGALEQCRTISDYGEPAPDAVVAVAVEVHERLLAVPSEPR